jgi:hypothetical protein
MMLLPVSAPAALLAALCSCSLWGGAAADWALPEEVRAHSP